MPDINVDRQLVAMVSLPLFLQEVERLVLEGYTVDMENDIPCEQGVLFTCSMLKTETSRNQADRAKIARAKRASLEQAEAAYMATLGKIIDENKKGN